MSRIRLAMIAILAITLSSCATPAPVEPPPDSPTEAAPPTGLPDPATIAAPAAALSADEVAQAVFQAWMADERAVAEPLTDPAAAADLDALFAQPFDAGAGWSYDHCEGAAGSVFCTWYGASATLVIQVRSIEPPVLVTSIRMEAAAAP
ncbi:MAG: hypothetical protein IPJ58_16040 [Ardenticatenia bacterium]|nr:hypothetical protein [Ardenticatenia bacterium]